MAGTQPSGDDDDLITAINVTPLVDVVLVLLIVLMVTATAIVSKTIPMELPEAATGETTPQNKTIAISITWDAANNKAALYLDATAVSSEDDLFAQVDKIAQSADEVRAVISAAGQVPHARVVKVMDILRRAKINKFAINVKPSDIK